MASADSTITEAYGVTVVTCHPTAQANVVSAIQGFEALQLGCSNIITALRQPATRVITEHHNLVNPVTPFAEAAAARPRGDIFVDQYDSTETTQLMNFINVVADSIESMPEKKAGDVTITQALRTLAQSMEAKHARFQGTINKQFSAKCLDVYRRAIEFLRVFIDKARPVLDNEAVRALGEGLQFADNVIKTGPAIEGQFYSESCQMLFGLCERVRMSESACESFLEFCDKQAVNLVDEANKAAIAALKAEASEALAREGQAIGSLHAERTEGNKTASEHIASCEASLAQQEIKEQGLQEKKTALLDQLASVVMQVLGVNLQLAETTEAKHLLNAQIGLSRSLVASFDKNMEAHIGDHAALQTAAQVALTQAGLLEADLLKASSEYNSAMHEAGAAVRGEKSLLCIREAEGLQTNLRLCGSDAIPRSCAMDLHKVERVQLDRALQIAIATRDTFKINQIRAQIKENEINLARLTAEVENLNNLMAPIKARYTELLASFPARDDARGHQNDRVVTTPTGPLLLRDARQIMAEIELATRKKIEGIDAASDARLRELEAQIGSIGGDYIEWNPIEAPAVVAVPAEPAPAPAPRPSFLSWFFRGAAPATQATTATPAPGAQLALPAPQ